MSDIIELASRLGKAIAQSPQGSAMRKARADMNAEEEVMKLLREFQEQSQKIADLQRDSKPIEPEDKQKLDRLHEQLISKEAFKKFTAAQVDYVDLMRKVNEAISNELQET